MRASVLVVAIAASACGPGQSASHGLVVLNEVSCHGRDWVEMVNVSGGEIDVSSWYVSDDTTRESHQYALPDGTIIGVGEYLVVKRQEGMEDGFSFGFACGEETAYVLDKDLDVVDQTDVGDIASGDTWGHLPDLNGIWRETHPTPGDANEAPWTTSE